MEENKKAAIEKIYQLTKQDAEFNEELRKKLGITSSASSALIDDDRLSHIYEYCIEKIISEQAENFYKNFPIKEIVTQLKEDFKRILTEPKNAIIKQYTKLLSIDDVKLTFNEKALRAIAKKAIEQKTGARSLKGIIEDIMLDIMYDIPNDKRPREIIVTEQCVTEGKKPEIRDL